MALLVGHAGVLYGPRGPLSRLLTGRVGLVLKEAEVLEHRVSSEALQGKPHYGLCVRTEPGSPRFKIRPATEAWYEHTVA